MPDTPPQSASAHEVISSLTRLENAFLDFRLRDFTDLKMQVSSAFGRMELIEQRIQTLEKKQADAKGGAYAWVQGLLQFFGGGLIVWLLTKH